MPYKDKERAKAYRASWWEANKDAINASRRTGRSDEIRESERKRYKQSKEKLERSRIFLRAFLEKKSKEKDPGYVPGR